MKYVLYHASCPDGFGAALAAWTRYRDDAKYIPVQYGEPLPEIEDGSEVYIVDFSYDRETLLSLKSRVETLVVLDHHKTARDALAGLDFATFDMDKSGAVLAWQYFHPGCATPSLFLLLQDRDLWKWELPNSRACSAYFSVIPRDFNAWNILLSESMDCRHGHWVDKGEAILAAQAIQASSLCDHAITANVRGYSVPSVNSPLLQSEIGEELCKRFPDAPFAAVFFHLGGKEVVWSLRSRNGFDVSAVAKSMGGGGHPAAAGFKIPIQQPGGMFDAV